MNVMQRAWKIAKQGVEKFGGKVKEYFAQALCMAWVEIKKGADKMVELQGSEKQVKWANDIRNNAVTTLNDVLDTITEVNEKNVAWVKNEKILGLLRENVQQLIEAFENEASAKFFIENRSDEQFVNRLFNAIADKHGVKNTFGRIIGAYNELKGE